MYALTLVPSLYVVNCVRLPAWPVSQ